MNAYDIMHEWDRAAGLPPRTDEELDRDVAAGLPCQDYEEWKRRLESGNVESIIAGLRFWGLPVGPLGPFEVDANIQYIERPD